MLTKTLLRTSYLRNSASRRTLFTLPKIPIIEENRENGINGLYSPNTVKQLWYEQGDTLVGNINQLMESSDESSNISLESLIIESFKQSNLIDIHSYSNSLFNLKFSLESLKNNDKETSIKYCNQEDFFIDSFSEDFENLPTDEKLVNFIDDSFGSILEFRTLLLNSSLAAKGDGFTWVVARASNTGLNKKLDFFNLESLYIFNTFNSGIFDDSIRSGQIEKLVKYTETRAEKLKNDEDDSKTISDKLFLKKQESELKNETASQSKNLSDAKFISSTFSKSKMIPLLAINNSPKNYLLDYGVFGKKRYLKNYWECIDWDVVASRLPRNIKNN